MNAWDANRKLNLVLKSVSRSFYLSMVFLPQAMRGPVSLAYLLARATDSVADSTNLPEGEKLTVLHLMGQAIQGKLAELERNSLISQLAGPFAQAQEKAAEGKLLQQFDTCLDLLHQAPPAIQTLIKKVLETIIKGQCWDLTYFEQQQCVQNDQETKDYTYMVAGCVGEFWTDVGIHCMGPHHFCEEGDEAMLRDKGIRYGCGLQLVNILRDRVEDKEHGRSYLVPGSKGWMEVAINYLQDGIDYSLKLKSLRLRFTALLPALIGVKTLKLIQYQETAQQGKAKITRCQVYTCMLQALLMCQWRRS